MDDFVAVQSFLQFAHDFLFSSSSDDSDEETERTPKSMPKVETFIRDVVDQWDDEMFRQSFRMRRSSFDKLVDELQSLGLGRKAHHGGVPEVPPRGKVMIFIWFAGNKCTMRETSILFGIALSTFHKIYLEIMDLLLTLAPKVIKFPTSPEEKQQTAEEFKEISGFPGVLGCIDGSYIPIRAPANKIKSTYVNRHDMTSITLQAICDANKRFLDVFTGPPSKIHDSRIFTLSFISSRIPEICEDEFHLLGDAAYPLRSYLLTPYRDYGNLTPQQQQYNKKFCQTRVKIENAFGLLKQRFRQLTRIDSKYVDTMTKFIISCCVLHNICLDFDDFWHDDCSFEVEHAGSCNDNNQNDRGKGERKRNDIAAML